MSTLITLAVAALPDIFIELPNTWPCNLSIVTVSPANIVLDHIQLPPLPSVSVVAVATLQNVVTTSLELVLVAVTLPINLVSAVEVETREAADVVSWVSDLWFLSWVVINISSLCL
jgi:hypothetical protein